MKLGSFLLFVFLFVSLSVAFNLQHKSLLENIKTKIHIEPAIWPYYNIILADNSTCGNVNCTNDNDCPSFPFVYGNCVNGFCEYQEDGDQNVCLSPSQCGSNLCNCDASGASDGCKCTSDDDCNSGTCYQGICQKSYGYLGEFCLSNADCFVGTCNKTNQCEIVPEGGTCADDSDCVPSCFCVEKTCEKRPYCNDTVDFPYAYCPNYGICYEGTCFPILQGKLGDECIIIQNCEPGLACLNATGTIKTCQEVPLGTPCEDDDECELLVQECLCTQPDNSFPMTCSDAGGVMCTDEYIDYANCDLKYNCDQYDILDPNTECYKYCLPKDYALFCCLTCLYPELADNAYLNLAGFCANYTLSIVNCCSSTTPCTIVPTDQLCHGYSELKKGSKN